MIGLAVMIADTGVSAGMPLATYFPEMSRKVAMPSRLSVSVTHKDEMCLSRMIRAAS